MNNNSSSKKITKYLYYRFFYFFHRSHQSEHNFWTCGKVITEKINSGFGMTI